MGTEILNKSLLGEHGRIAVLIILVFASAITFAYVKMGTAPLLIIGIPGVFTYWFWFTNYLKSPTHPSVILPPFLITVAGFEFHVIEEYTGNYAQAISRIFNFAWPDTSFSIVMFILSGTLFLVAVGLYYQKPFAGFIAILFVITRFAEILLFIFPFIKPQIHPEMAGIVSQNISGTMVTDMPSYYYPIMNHYYFPGMYTWILTLVPAIVVVCKIINAKKRTLHNETNY